MSTAVVSVRVYPDKYKMNFDAVVTIITHYIDKKGPTTSVKVASVSQTRPAKWQEMSAICGTFKGKIELKNYSRKEYDSISMTHWLYELWYKT